MDDEGDAMSEDNLIAVAPAVRHEPTRGPSKAKAHPRARPMSSNLAYWIVLLGAAALLLWGWAVAIQNIVAGTTVKLG
jgi:hypothetical protein